MPTTERVIQNHLQKKTIRLGERQCAYIDMGQQQADRGSVPLIFIHGWCQSLE